MHTSSRAAAAKQQHELQMGLYMILFDAWLLEWVLPTPLTATPSSTSWMSWAKRGAKRAVSSCMGSTLSSSAYSSSSAVTAVSLTRASCMPKGGKSARRTFLQHGPQDLWLCSPEGNVVSHILWTPNRTVGTSSLAIGDDAGIWHRLHCIGLRSQRTPFHLLLQDTMAARHNSCLGFQHLAGPTHHCIQPAYLGSPI